MVYLCLKCPLVVSRSSPIDHFKEYLLTAKVNKAISPDFKQGFNPDYDYYVFTKLTIIEDLFRLMKLSTFHPPYHVICTNENTFFELYDKSLIDLEILLHGMEKEYKASKCYDGC